MQNREVKKESEYRLTVIERVTVIERRWKSCAPLRLPGSCRRPEKVSL